MRRQTCFFFSSRRRHTSSKRDWSSDVCSSDLRGYLTCPDCNGARLRREARDVQVAGRTIDRVSALTVREAQDFFEIGRASCRERVEISVGGGGLKEKERHGDG